MLSIGTRSVLFGAHQFLIHPLFVAAAWWKLYGFPRDPRLWIAFFVHDLGYWGKPNMDGPEGETHVFLGAEIMHFLFDHELDLEGCEYVTKEHPVLGKLEGRSQLKLAYHRDWYNFTLYHSRFHARRDGVDPSRLCIADKLSVCLEPWWLYLPRVILSGEIREYMDLASGRENSKYAGEPNTPDEAAKVTAGSRRAWFRGMTSYLRRWVAEHQDGRPDTWTPVPNQEAPTAP